MAIIYTVYRRCYPSFDEAIDSFDTKKEAEWVANDLTECWKDPGWEGHKNYRCSCYVREEDTDEIPYRALENADCFCYGDTVD